MEVQTEKKAEKKTTKPWLKDIQKLIDGGIPVRYAKFKDTVLSIEKTPETGFYAPEDNMKRAKVAKMWFVGSYNCLITEQESKTEGTVYKLIPLGACSDTIVA